MTNPRKSPTALVGRGAHTNPPNRFERVRCETEFESASAAGVMPQKRPATYIADDSQSIVSSNDSPDLQYRHSLNPYRGCAHGCSYCYARTYHEFLGFSGGLDFETKLLFKPAAAKLLEAWLKRPGWTGEPIMLSGATDCYQGCEREFELTRQCLAVALAFRQPVSIVTKNALVLRDLDLLCQLARHDLVHVSISLTSLDATLLRKMEPRTSSSVARLRAIRELASHEIPTKALLAPVIPGLTDHEVPRLLQAAAEAGAHAAGCTILRLPGVVREVFCEWLERELPHKVDVVRSRVQQMRAGRWNDGRFHSRMNGEGELAKQIHRSFDVFAQRLGLGTLRPLSSDYFSVPGDVHQRRLFY